MHGHRHPPCKGYLPSCFQSALGSHSYCARAESIASNNHTPLCTRVSADAADQCGLENRCGKGRAQRRSDHTLALMTSKNFTSRFVFQETLLLPLAGEWEPSLRAMATTPKMASLLLLAAVFGIADSQIDGERPNFLKT